MTDIAREDEQQEAEDREDELLKTIAALRRELSNARLDRYVTLARVKEKMLGQALEMEKITRILDEVADTLDEVWYSLSDEERRRLDKPEDEP